MKFILLLFILPACLPVPAAERAFYLWQRSWTPETELAVRACDRPLSAFAAELSRDKTERSAAPAEFWRRPGVTAVFRLRLDAFSTEGFRRLAAEIVRNGCPRVQLDADIPERRLAEYADRLKELRQALPASVREFSITALPCHLPHAAFADAARQADYYVLQLHGLDVPRNIEEPYALLDPAVARTAIVRARKLGRPFRLALPTYAYRLSFDPGTGAFAAISAEGGAPPEGRWNNRLAAPGPALLRDLLRENPDLPVIWFRLPVRGDLLNYDRETIAQLETGVIPVERLDIELRRTAPNAVELRVTPRARIQLEPLRLELSWPRRTGEFDLAPGVRNESGNRAFAVLPDRLSVPFGGCGTQVRAATFFIDETNHPVIKEIKP